MRHCRTCTCPPVKRKAIAKVSRKVSTRAVDGIRTFTDGRQRCYGKAWEKRKGECFLRDEYHCQQRLDHFSDKPVVGVFWDYPVCNRLLENPDPHHIGKRSVGRDDRLANLVTLCREHHELYDSKPQWSKK